MPLLLLLSLIYYCSSISTTTNQLLSHCLFDAIQLCYSTIYLLCTPTSSYHQQQQQQPSSSRFTAPKTNQHISAVIIHILSDFVYTAAIMNSIINHEFR